MQLIATMIVLLLSFMFGAAAATPPRDRIQDTILTVACLVLFSLGLGRLVMISFGLYH